MICPHCGGDNPAGARFCMHCGRPLPHPCANCGTVLPAEARFCFNCGHGQEQTQAEPALPTPDVTTPASEPGGDLLARLVPKGLMAKLEAARDDASGALASGERRIVTVLFCDVKGSTAAAGQLDPEEWAEIINGAFEHMIRPVYQYEGTVARLMGDGVLAFFGAPIAHEDDPQRAILAALEIQSQVAGFSEQISREWGIDLAVRAGINTGMVVVGAVGSDLRLEYSALGDAINLAARMEQTAQPGTVQITADTQRLVEPLFTFEDLGPIEVKGKNEPVQAFRVTGLRSQAAGLRGIRGHEAPLTGREVEFELLRDQLRELAGDRGGVLLLLGEAGLGKSRLIRETRSAHQDARHGGRWYEAASLSYETMQPYGLFQRLVRHVAGLTMADSLPLVMDRLAEITGDMAEPGKGFAVFEQLLTGRTSEQDDQLEGEQFRLALADSVRQLLARGDTVVVLDDLHWSDQASLDLLGELLPLSTSAAVLFILAARPDAGVLRWSEGQRDRQPPIARWRQIRLAPLSQDDGDRLVSGLFDRVDLPNELRHQIQERSGGNPFFLEEIIRSLIDSGHIRRDAGNGRWTVDDAAARVELPESLQGLLLARIDRLEEQTRRTLQLASVIGRSFYYRVLAMLVEAAAGLDERMSELERAELIREAALIPEREFVFTHALTQEAAYSSILLKRRRVFHQRVGEIIERVFENRQEEMAPALAQHFLLARNQPKAAHYLVIAGDQAFRLYANQEAVGHYHQALDLLLEQDDCDPGTIRHVFERCGRALELQARYEEALALYDQMEQWAQQAGEGEAELASLLKRATIRSTANPLHDAALARQLLERAKKLSQELGDDAAEARILWTMVLVSTMNSGDAAEHLQWATEALTLAERAGEQELEAFILLDSWYPLSALGQLQVGLEHLKRAEAIWSRSRNLPMQAECNSRMCYSYTFLGEYSAAIEAGERAYQLGKLAGNLEAQAVACASAGQAYLNTGDLGRALATWQQAVELSERVQAVTGMVGGRSGLGRLYGLLGDTDLGRSLLEASYEWTERAQIRSLAGWVQSEFLRFLVHAGQLAEARRVLKELGSYQVQRQRVGFIHQVWVGAGQGEAELALAEQNPARAHNIASEVRTQMEALGIKLMYDEVLLQEARALFALGNTEAVVAVLDRALAVSEELGSNMTRWQILALRAEAAERVGHREQASRHRERARAVVERIAATLPDDGLRDSWLTQPALAALTNPPA